MGLDLAIVKKFANLMGGDIGVGSEVGKGSKFTITIPIALKVSQGVKAEGLGVNTGKQPKKRRLGYLGKKLLYS